MTIRKPARRTTKVWDSLVTRCLPLQDRDAEFWWQLTGYHMAHMLDAAGYTVERQYEVLLFHYLWIVPRLGPAPDADGVPKWKAVMAHEGSPLEYSWKWNTTTSQPEIRYSWEPFNPGSDRNSNPLNHANSLDYMQTVSHIVRDVDFTWARHFLRELEKEDRPASYFLHAVEYNPAGKLGLKSYFAPRCFKLLEGGDSMVKKEWDDAITKLGPSNACRDNLMEFLANNPEGKLMKPIVLAMDDVKPSKSRLKFYLMTPHTSFASLKEIMTMGGLIDIPEANMKDLRSLIQAIIGVPSDYPEHANMPITPPIGKTWADTENLFECFVYFFDIAPQNPQPEIKLYLPARMYGPDDLEIAYRLMDWMRARGRGAYCDQYLRMLEVVGEHRGLANGKGLHSFISYQIKNGEADVKSYFTPEAYHPARFGRA
ncbi:aromatic prenyltransferase [Hypoxylon trugodes]|uniref:aromatic prenyltransferase n=1 Tax=Hypoxylon trugodes TaxID=326681 RepID=UPI0021988D07|nr:aromatic prenyltransferase [Hypoxylon trugodes]KAI1390512.1 aromatic prenyltransferase [Hypoxylon trugodes]